MKDQKSFFPMPRRTFLTTVSLGLAAGLGDSRHFSLAQSKTAKAVSSISALMNPQMTGCIADLYLQAAIQLQALEPGNAQDVLFSIASAKEKEANLRASYSFWHDNLVPIILCRMLFTAKKTSSETSTPEFRRARYGGPGFFGGTSLEDWTLEPIEIIDGVPFNITNGYFLAGYPEHGTSYLSYCIENCDWNSFEFTPKDVTLKRAALDRLLSSPKWKQELSIRDKKFLSAQIQ